MIEICKVKFRFLVYCDKGTTFFDFFSVDILENQHWNEKKSIVIDSYVSILRTDFWKFFNSRKNYVKLDGFQC